MPAIASEWKTANRLRNAHEARVAHDGMVGLRAAVSLALLSLHPDTERRSGHPMCHQLQERFGQGEFAEIARPGPESKASNRSRLTASSVAAGAISLLMGSSGLHKKHRLSFEEHG